MLTGFLFGVVFIGIVDRYLSSNSLELFKSAESSEVKSSTFLANMWVFILAIIIHNFPEGMAVGVGFSTGDFNLGLPIGIAIGQQNIPEGLVVAVACMAMGYSKRRAFFDLSHQWCGWPCGRFLWSFTRGLLSKSASSWS